MIFGHISSPDSYQHLLTHPIWKRCFDWLKTVDANTPAGIQKLLGDDVVVNVHGYDTLPEAECRFESHRHVVDLQYCICGGELIAWQQASRLLAAGPYEEVSDIQFYQPAPAKTVLHMLSGNFAIFHPSDAHRPKCRDGLHAETFKLVIKIKLACLKAEAG